MIRQTLRPAKPQRSILRINRPKAMPADRLLIKSACGDSFPRYFCYEKGFSTADCYTGSEPQHAFVYRHRFLMLHGLCITLHKSTRNFLVTEEQKSVDWLTLRNYLVLFSFQAAYRRQTLRRRFCFHQQKQSPISLRTGSMNRKRTPRFFNF